MAVKTFTMASATAGDRIYIDNNLQAHTITQNETFVLTIDDETGSVAGYTGNVTSAELKCTDGFKIYLNAEKSYIRVSGDATANLNAGSLWFLEDDDGVVSEIKIKSVTFDDADAPSTAEFICERADAPIYSWTWTGITVA